MNEVRIGEMLHYIPRGTLQSIERESLPIEYSENDYSEEENIRLLREKILEVHADWAGENNVVYLSGGIDSCVMLASLHNIVRNKHELFPIVLREVRKMKLYMLKNWLLI